MKKTRFRYRAERVREQYMGLKLTSAGANREKARRFAVDHGENVREVMRRGVGRPMVEEKSISVSLRASASYREAVRRIAAKNGIKVADLTRSALDSSYPEIAREARRIEAE